LYEVADSIHRDQELGGGDFSQQNSVFDSRILTQRQFKEKPPRYIQKEDFGVKFQFQRVPMREKDANGMYEIDRTNSTESVTSPSFQNTQNLGIRQLVSQSRKRSVVRSGGPAVDTAAGSAVVSPRQTVEEI
jgi:hypothetical protein